MDQVPLLRINANCCPSPKLPSLWMRPNQWIHPRRGHKDKTPAKCYCFDPAEVVHRATRLPCSAKKCSKDHLELWYLHAHSEWNSPDKRIIILECRWYDRRPKTSREFCWFHREWCTWHVRPVGIVINSSGQSVASDGKWTSSAFPPRGTVSFSVLFSFINHSDIVDSYQRCY